MSRYTNVDILINGFISKLDDEETLFNQVARRFIYLLRSSLSIDIVKCKECIHWDRAIDESGIERFNFSKCTKGHYGNGLEFYCADGEKEEP